MDDTDGRDNAAAQQLLKHPVPSVSGAAQVPNKVTILCRSTIIAIKMKNICSICTEQ